MRYTLKDELGNVVGRIEREENNDGGCIGWIIVFCLGLILFCAAIGAVMLLPNFLLDYLKYKYTYMAASIIVVINYIYLYVHCGCPVSVGDVFHISKLEMVPLGVVVLVHNVKYEMSPLGGWENMMSSMTLLGENSLIAILLTGSLMLMISFLAAFCFCVICSVLSILIHFLVKKLRDKSMRV